MPGSVAARCASTLALREAQLLRLDKRHQRPAHDGEPLRIVLAHGGSERLLGDQLRQDNVIAGRLSLLRATASSETSPVSTVQLPAA